MIKEEHKQILASLSSLLENEHDMIANMANTSAVLYEFLPDINWAGFYLYKNNELILGPFQGKPACMHIPMGKGVCGVCAKTLLTQRIDNVHEFPGHIACDCASNSEIVIPIVKENTLLGVLDIDSPKFSRFDEEDKLFLEKAVSILLQSL
ncbi:MAG: GAF domain-containing protein [Clostridium sp.]